MPDFTVSGAGTSGVNGDYTSNGTQGGKTRYVHSGGVYAIGWSLADGMWLIYSVAAGTATYLYATEDGSGATPPLTGWYENTGAAPAPTVTVYSGGGTGGGGSQGNWFQFL